MKFLGSTALLIAFLSVNVANAASIQGSWKLESVKCSSGAKMFSDPLLASVIKDVQFEGKVTIGADKLAGEQARRFVIKGELLDTIKEGIKQARKGADISNDPAQKAMFLQKAVEFQDKYDQFNAGMPCAKSSLKSYSISGSSITTTVEKSDGTCPTDIEAIGLVRTESFKVDDKRLSLSVPAPRVTMGAQTIGACKDGDQVITTYRRQ